MVDLRSDTVTRPTRSMLDAMLEAKVGDDVFGDDPTVNLLEDKAANLFGTEAALFCPSGTMSNQIGLKAHTRPGDEIICDRSSHIYNFEGGGIALNSGCSVRLMNGDRGRFTAQEVKENINDASNDHLALTKVVAIENTSNKGGGSYYDFKVLREIKEICRSNSLYYHLDGARLFNALTVTNESPVDYGKLFDSLSVCLSKGLGAPAGSILLGNKDFIAYARRFRKAFGGGMRQAGYLAAAGIFALDNNISRLKEDHSRAKDIESVLRSLSYVESISPVDTNILVFKLNQQMDSTDFLNHMLAHGVSMIEFGPQTIRAVTHLDISDDDIELTKSALKSI